MDDENDIQILVCVRVLKLSMVEELLLVLRPDHAKNHLHHSFFQEEQRTN